MVCPFSTGDDEDKGRDLLREPQDITQSLQRTRALMAQELDRLSNVVQVMGESGRVGSARTLTGRLEGDSRWWPD